MKRIISSLLFVLLVLTALSPLLFPTEEAEAVDPVHEYKFHNHEDLTYDLHQWLSEYPHIMELSSIGTSYLPIGNPHELWNVHLTNYQENRNRDLPEIYLDGGHHGNEYCGSEITILVIQYLLENYGTDPDATYILDNSHVYITPMINPDGIDLDTRMNSRQVDLNRNYPYEWTSGSTHGSGPASEREVAANIAFMEKHDFDLYLTGHTGIVYLIYPWGYTRDPSPDDSLFKKTEEEVEAQWDIPTGQSSVALYIAKGTGKDYGYAVNHAPSWTFEVDSEQFVPVSGEAISQRLQPIFECYMFLMKEAISGKWWPKLNVTGTGVKGGGDDELTLQFTVNNSGYVDVVNGTATLDMDGEQHSTLFSVGQFNETLVNFTLGDGWEGEYDYTLTLDYTKMVVNGSKPLSHVQEGSVEVEEGSSFLVALGGMDIVLVLASALIVQTIRQKMGPGKKQGN